MCSLLNSNRLNILERILIYGIITITLKVEIRNGHDVHDVIPEFRSPIIIQPLKPTVEENVTLGCRIENLGDYIVSWYYIDQKTLLTKQYDVLVYDPRMGVRFEIIGDLSVWFLIISNVSVADSGYYMCQLNTHPPKKILKFLDIIVPPKFDNNGFKIDTEITVKEYENISIPCMVTGNPKPKVIWKKEDGHSVIYSSNSTSNGSTEMSSEILLLNEVSRWASGNYICIASNDITPSISRRVIVNVLFPPIIMIPNQMATVAIGSDAAFGCIIESNPPAQHVWIDVFGNKINNNNNNKYSIKLKRANRFKVYLTLTVNNAGYNDAGPYTCLAKNDIGETRSVFTLRVSEQLLQQTTDAIPAYDDFYIDSRHIPKKQLIIESEKEKIENSGSIRIFTAHIPFLILFIIFFVISIK